MTLIQPARENRKTGIRAGEWRRSKRGGMLSKTSRVYMGCPGCGNVSALDHEIDKDGNITPSVACTMCEFHETGVQLVDWSA